MKTRTYSKTTKEVVCITCDGAGLAPGSTMLKPVVCPGCNGHGLVVVTLHHRDGVLVNKYDNVFDIEATERTVLATIDGRHN